MVIGDWYREQPPSNQKNTGKAQGFVIANPFDRLYAQVFDLVVVFAPFFALLAAPLRRQMGESALRGEWDVLTSGIAEICLLFFSAYVFSQVMCHLVFGNTLGKKILGLKVINLWTGKEPGVWDQVMRSIYVFVQFIFLGIPFLYVMTNRKHRGFHDQLSDTVVLNIKGEAAPLFRLWPLKAFNRVMALSLMAMILPLLFQSIRWSASFIEFDQFWMAQVDSDVECENTNSLEEAMALVASGYMDTECLRKPTEIEFVDGASPSPLGYLAKSFLYVDSPKLSNLYLAQVCREDDESAACVLAQFISFWSDEEIDAVEAVLEKAKAHNKPFLTLWALRYYQQAGLYKKSLDLSENLKTDDRFGLYVQTQRLKAKYLLNDERSSDEALFSMAKKFESPIVLDTMAWSCMRKVSLSCEGVSHPFCQKVEEAKMSENVLQTRVLLGKMKLSECRGEKVKPTQYLSKRQPSSWKKFIYALSKESRGDEKSAWSLYFDVVKSSSSPDYLKAEAVYRMTLHPELSELKDLNRHLSRIETFEHRRQAAEIMVSMYQKLNLLQLAQGLVEEYQLEPLVIDNMRLPASESGKLEIEQ